MHDDALPHTHPDGARHAHRTVLAPEVATLLQKVEDFAGSLEPVEEAALRRLLRVAMAGVARHAAGHDDTTGYDHSWYYTWYAVNHAHPIGDAAGATPPIYHYYPAWWPAGRARTQPSSRSPPADA